MPGTDARSILSAFAQCHGALDCAFVLDGGLRYSIKEAVSDSVHPAGRLLYEPGYWKAGARQKQGPRLVRGAPHPGRTLLIVDDSYYSGASFREAVAYFMQQGYERPYIYCFYYFGGRNHPSRPVLASADEFMQRILPQQPRSPDRPMHNATGSVITSSCIQ